jgi:thiamine pyrophosphokinase
MKKALILANGEHPKKSQIKILQKKGYKKLVCADGGANSAYKLGLLPDLIIGDLDSISPISLKFFSNKSEIVKIKRQNDTDVEKALKYLIKNKFAEVILLGATGDRLDHTFCNLGIVLKFSKQIKISIMHKKSFLSLIEGVVNLKTQKGEILSIYGFDEKTKITSEGLKYKLNNLSLPFGIKESTSNVAAKDKVNLKIKGGKVFIIRDFETMVKNDFI